MTAPGRTTVTCPTCTHHVPVHNGRVAYHCSDGERCHGIGRTVPSGQTLTVLWHPNAVRTAATRLSAIVASDGFNPDDVYRVAGMPILGQDLMCLVDVARAALGGA